MIKRGLALVVVLVIASVVGPRAVSVAAGALPDWWQPDPAASGEVTQPTASAAALQSALTGLPVLEQRPDVDGYDRECGTGHACSFGQAWSDDTTAEFGHNGCDTRNDMLAAALADVVYREGTHDCVVVGGALDDPFTGERIEFVKERAYEVGVDHMVPLAMAWDLGASGWTPEKRQLFANDPINLTVVSGSANSSKGDSGLGEWLPINRSYRCTYAARYLAVARAYDLPITSADADAVVALAPIC